MKASKVTKIGLAALSAASLLASFATPAFAQEKNTTTPGTTITISKTNTSK